MRISPHFDSSEFTLDNKYEFTGGVPLPLLISLEFYREQIKASFERNEGFLMPEQFTGLMITNYARTSLYNQSVDGHPNSHHLYDSRFRTQPDAVDFTCAYFDKYDHTKHLSELVVAMQNYSIFLSIGYYPDRKFIHINLESSFDDTRRWTK